MTTQKLMGHLGDPERGTPESRIQPPNEGRSEDRRRAPPGRNAGMTYMERALRDAPPDYEQDAVKLRDAADRCAERGWFDMADTLRRAARLCDVEARKPLITIGETPGRLRNTTGE